MICYEDELVVKVWLHGCGHASGLIRTLDTRYLGDNPANINTLSTYISWWPGVDYNKHSTPVGGFKKKQRDQKNLIFKTSSPKLDLERESVSKLTNKISCQGQTKQ